MLVVIGTLGLGAVGAAEATVGQPAAQSTTVEGDLIVMWAYPHGPTSHLVTLTTDDGTSYALNLAKGATAAAGGLARVDRTRVRVTGTSRPLASQANARPTLDVSSVALVSDPKQSPDRTIDATAQPIVGQQRFVSILCRFADSPGTTPQEPSYFTGLLGSSRPGISHFWKENSYSLIDNEGSTVVGWFNLPQPRSYYVFSEEGPWDLDFDRTARDCTAMADSVINFNNYIGINLMFNQRLDCCAYGGGRHLTLDGTDKFWPVTWMPPWGYGNQDVLGHEMGHAYGLPHSSGPYSETYDSGWDVMSNGGICSPVDPTYGCVGVHTIAYHKDSLGWVPASRKYVAAPSSDQTITLSNLATSPTTTGPYLIAQIPIGASANEFYTVEARKRIGYDEQVPGEAIVIHKVNTTLEDRRAKVVDADANGNPNDAGAMWTPGETFTDAGQGISVAVQSSDANGFTVRIQRGAVVAPSNDNYPGTDVDPPRSGQPRHFSLHNGGATTQAGEPTSVCGSVPTGKTVWYHFVSSASGELTVDTVNSSFDTVLAVFTGGAVGSLTPVPGACNDDQPQTTNARVVFTAAANTNYYVQVGGFNGASGDMSVTFSGDFVVPPPNNDFYPGTGVTPPTASQPRQFTASTTGASIEAGEPTAVCTVSTTEKPLASGPQAVPTGRTVWYQIAIPSAGDLTIDTAISDFDTVLAVFTGSSVGSLTALPGACNDDHDGSLKARVVFTASAGTTYYVQAGGYNGASGNLGIVFSGDFGASLTPAAPTGVSALALNPTTVRVSWSDNSNNETGFEVTNGEVTRLAPANATSFDWTGLAPKTHICFRVRAVNANGASDYSPSPYPFCAQTPGDAVADYDGDGVTDVGVYRPSNAIWFIQRSGGGNTILNWGSGPDDIPVVGDFDGDGQADVAVYRPSNQLWFIQRSTGGTSIVNWGSSGDIPLTGDFDGDGKDDITVYRPSNQLWFVQRSSGAGTLVVNWGSSGDLPAPGDFDGDGQTDIAVYRPSNQLWFVRNSSSGAATIVNWGSSGDIPKVGDFDGDGKDDITVYRPSNQLWFVRNSSSGAATIVNWGSSGDVPLIGDYDGDGRDDIAVFRPSTGFVYLNRSGAGLLIVNWGASGDIPLGRVPLSGP